MVCWHRPYICGMLMYHYEKVCPGDFLHVPCISNLGPFKAVMGGRPPPPSLKTKTHYMSAFYNYFMFLAKKVQKNFCITIWSSFKNPAKVPVTLIFQFKVFRSGSYVYEVISFMYKCINKSKELTILIFIWLCF